MTFITHSLMVRFDWKNWWKFLIICWKRSKSPMAPLIYNLYASAKYDWSNWPLRTFFDMSVNTSIELESWISYRRYSMELQLQGRLAKLGWENSCHSIWRVFRNRDFLTSFRIRTLSRFGLSGRCHTQTDSISLSNKKYSGRSK